MIANFRNSLELALLPRAEEIYNFEAPGTRPGTPAGSRKDYIRFHLIVNHFLSELADTLATEYGDGIYAERAGKYWRKIEHGQRACYIPCGSPPYGKSVASTPKWLSWRALQSFSFRHVLGFCEDGRASRRILIDHVTGKSTRGDKVDGNAHERLSYKLLQYVETIHADDSLHPCELFIFGNGAFSKYMNRFYPSVQRHISRMETAFPGFKATFAIEPREYLELGATIVEWLGEQPPAVIRRRQRRFGTLIT